MRGLTWLERAARVRAGEAALAAAEVDEPIDSYQRLFAALFQHSFDSVVLCTAAGEYLAVSDSFCDLTGYPREELLGQTSLTLGLVDPKGTRVIAERDIEAGKPGLYENVMRRKDGDERDVEFSQQLLGSDYTIVIIRDISERRREELVLLELASTDPLTGLLNRRSFFAKVSAALSDSPDPVQILLADLDRLKVINDTHGHARGDEALRTFSRTLSDVVAGSGRPTLVARLGGDEFAVLITGAAAGEVERLAESVNARLRRQPIDGEYFSASFGFATRQKDDASADDLLRRADEELYVHKRSRTGDLQVRAFDREESRVDQPID